MDAGDGNGTVTYGLLQRLTDQLLCSRCLGEGRRTPVPQVLSRRHRPRSLCPGCQATVAGPGTARRIAGLTSLLARLRAP